MNLSERGNEVHFSDRDVLLSTTQLDSTITYANDKFCEIAGYELDELVGQHHNMVRHRDMPKLAFADLWQTIRDGRSWMGMVKNRCKNGDYYWVNAFVTPIKDETGQIVEYQSIRTKPQRHQVERAQTEYTKLNEGHKSSALKKPVDYTFWIFIFLLLSSAGALVNLILNPGSLLIGLEFGLASIATAGFAKWRHGYLKVLDKAKNIFDNDMMGYIYTGSRDKLNSVSLALEMQQAKLRAVVGRVNDVSERVSNNAKLNTSTGLEVSDMLKRQNEEVGQVAVSIHQFSDTIQDLARSINEASDVASQSESQVQQGKNAVDNTIDSIQQLDVQLAHVDKNMSLLVEGAGSIESVLAEINSIAEQTNLLALNAAIEAARAGGQGRGFAVVADEVRSLASRTQQSTEEINRLLADLRQVSDKAVEAMQHGNTLSSKTVEMAKASGVSLDGIKTHVTNLADLNRSSAAAIEEQSVVAEQVKVNVQSIRDLAENCGERGAHSHKLSTELLEQVHEQSSLISQFG